MLALFAKLILFLLATTVGTSLPLALVALSLTALNQYLNRPKFTFLATGIILVLVGFFPVSVPFLPLFFFDGLKQFPKKHWLGLGLLLAIPMFWQMSYFAFILSGTAFFLHHLTFLLADLTALNRAIRDFHEESGSALKRRNEELLDKQDYEIHLATLKERNRIARDIHDNVGHGLSRAILQTGALQAINSDSKLEPFLTGLQETLTDAMNSIRGSVHDLKDDAVDLGEAAQKILEEAPYQLNFNYDIGDDIPNPVKYCFLTVLKEALTNTAKHSDATQLQVTLQEHPALYQFLMADNGSTPPAKKARGIGLQNIEERVQNLGGYCNFTYQNGFRIFITIPKEG